MASMNPTLPGLGGPCWHRPYEWAADVGDVLIALACVLPDGHRGDHDYAWVEVADRPNVETVHVTGGVL